MIVDTGADLNVYLETGEDGEKKSSCCSPASAGGCDDAGVAAAAAAAAAPCGSGCSVPTGVIPEKTNLNEFVGKQNVRTKNDSEPVANTG
jgi:phage tail sheath protein FI